jgi:hypothetical protein
MSMDTPNKKYPNAPTTTTSEMPMWTPDHSIKGSGFDQLVQQRGIRFLHRRGIACPNITSTEANNHAPECKFCDSNGIVYYTEQEIYGTFSGNSIQKQFEAHGVWEIGTASITFPTVYADGTEADFSEYDKLMIPDFEVRLYELKDYEKRPNGQQLRYPVKKVDTAFSIVDGVQTFYTVDVDFKITPEGNIYWIPGRQPPIDPNNNKGAVIAWSYYANPVYVVLQSLRELRITQEVVNGQKQARRLPQQVLVRRDFMVGAGEKLTGTDNG